MAGVEPLRGEQVGLGDPVLAARQPVEDPAVGQGAARHGLDVAEVGAGQAQADGGVRAEAVAWFQYDEAAPGAHEGGAGPQHFLERFVERGRTGQALGQFVEGGEVGDPAGETVLQYRAGWGRGVCGDSRGGTRRAGRDSVCGCRNR